MGDDVDDDDPTILSRIILFEIQKPAFFFNFFCVTP
jgi:hypothetical protein